MRHAEQLADTLQTLAQFPRDNDPLEVWVVRPRPPRKIAPKATIRRWLKKALAALAHRTADASGKDVRGQQATCTRPDATHEHQQSVRLRVLQPGRELAGSFLDFDPGKIRAWYEDGLRTARSGQTVDLESNARPM